MAVSQRMTERHPSVVDQTIDVTYQAGDPDRMIASEAAIMLAVSAGLRVVATMDRTRRWVANPSKGEGRDPAVNGSQAPTSNGGVRRRQPPPCDDATPYPAAVPLGRPSGPNRVVSERSECPMPLPDTRDLRVAKLIEEFRPPRSTLIQFDVPHS